MPKTIDFTRMRLHRQTRNGLRVEECPACRRKGEGHYYPKTGEAMFIHKGYIAGIFFNVTDSCTLPTVLPEGEQPSIQP